MKVGVRNRSRVASVFLELEAGYAWVFWRLRDVETTWSGCWRCFLWVTDRAGRTLSCRCWELQKRC